MEDVSADRRVTQQDLRVRAVTVAGLEGETIDAMLLSVDRFCAPHYSSLCPGVRRELLTRLGLFGVRFAIEGFRNGWIRTASELSRELVAISGLEELRALLETRFVARARVLKARSALAALRSLRSLRSLSAELREAGGRSTAAFDREIERVEAASHEPVELRVLQELIEGRLQVSDDERAEIERLMASDDPRQRLGLDPEASPADAASEALAAAERWRSRGESPLADREMVQASDVLARSYEGIYLATRQG